MREKIRILHNLIARGKLTPEAMRMLGISVSNDGFRIHTAKPQQNLQKTGEQKKQKEQKEDDDLCL